MTFYKMYSSYNICPFNSLYHHRPNFAEYIRMFESDAILLILVRSQSDIIKIRTQLPKLPSYGQRGQEFTNSFIDEFRIRTNLESYEPVATDSRIYAMTYFRFGVIMRKFHEKISSFKMIRGLRFMPCTHLLMLDAWNPDMPIASVLYMYNLLASYGCYMPRLVHVSTGPVISVTLVATLEYNNNNRIKITASDGIKNTSNVNTKIDEIILSWNNITYIGTKYTDGITALINATLNEPGKTYIVLPDKPTADIIQRNFPISINIVYYYQFHDIDFTDMSHLIIIPLVRVSASERKEMNSASICALIGSLPNYVSPSGVPVKITVSLGGESQYIRCNVLDVLTKHPTVISRVIENYISTVPVTEQLSTLIHMASSSIPVDFLSPKTLELAVSRGLVEVSRDTVTKTSVVSRVLLEGTYCGKTGLSASLVELILAWSKTKYLPFPMLCLVAILEHYERGIPTLIEKHISTIAGNAVPDNITQALMVVIEYITKYRLVITDVENIEAMCNIYGINAVTLLGIMARILNLYHNHSSKIYGPFPVPEFIQAFFEVNKKYVFAHLREKVSIGCTGYATSIDGLIKNYDLDANLTVYQQSSRILILQSNVITGIGMLRNIPKANIVVLYAAYI